MRRQLEIRWIGDDESEAALLDALDRPMRPTGDGLCERWMHIPERMLREAMGAIELAGGKVIAPQEKIST